MRIWRVHRAADSTNPEDRLARPGRARAERPGPTWASELSGDGGRLLKVFDVLGRECIATDTPVAAFDFVDRDPRDATQRLSLNANHCLGELGDHLLLLAAVEDTLDDFDLYERHVASFAGPGLGTWNQVFRGGLRAACGIPVNPVRAAASVLQVRLQ